jgi:hypothetical protein
MREHPIPQDVTGYRFHIIGNMTLKQFIEVAAGVVVAVILYNTNLAGFIKWPLMLISGGMGALIAWVPFEERPLDHWLTVFFTVLYHPTKFFWQKQARIPAPFLFKPRQDQINAPEVIDLSPARRTRIQEYLTSVAPTQPKEDWEVTESEQVSAILKAFDTVQVNHVSATKTAHKPTMEVRVRNLHAFSAPTEDASVTPIVEETPQPDPPIASEATPPVEPSIESIDQPATVEPPAPAAQPLPPLIPDAQPQAAVTTNAQLPFPNQPTTPNKIVGMVLDKEGKIVASAIVEIKNLQGLVARAVKTNALGQFFVSTPLENGTYSVHVDKANLQFDPQRMTLTGQIVPPLQLTAV